MNLQEIKKNPQIKEFLKQTEIYLNALDYTDHGERHVNIVADRAKKIALKAGLSERESELASIAGYCHDMGNFLGRSNHHYFSALLFSQIFIEKMPVNDLSIIMQAISSHDKHEYKIVNKVTACLVLADKSDVHRTRVKKKNMEEIRSDIHDRVNYAVIKNDLNINNNTKKISLKMIIDTKIVSPMEYFEIFLDRMTFCREAAKSLGYDFILIINNFRLS